MDCRLDGKVALVTGGASGIGEATARGFASSGAQVLILDIDANRAAAVAHELPGSRAIVCDVTRPAAVRSAFSTIEQLDILVNNAGTGLAGSVEETELADFQRLFQVNVEGLFLVTKAAMPLLLASHGSIVNIGSVGALVGLKRRFAYCAAKGAVVSLTRQLAIEYAKQVRVNCICPGTVDTPFVEQYLETFPPEEIDQVRAELSQRQPLGRLGRPEEVAAMIVYLASPQAEFVTGSILTIDGGLTAA
ncbi:MAG TPA: SDR family oxidoreductase [Bryobacteraceae bacterium]|nr:SDR family oxidoreductase [Bryobacteraceae bacterium]